MSEISGARARVSFLSTEEGGRTQPIISGYRPSFHFREDASSLYDGVMTLEDCDQAQPGGERVVRIEFLHPEYIAGFLKPGLSFAVHEGRRVVGKGTVLSILKQRHAQPRL